MKNVVRSIFVVESFNWKASYGYTITNRVNGMLIVNHAADFDSEQYAVEMGSAYVDQMLEGL